MELDYSKLGKPPLGNSAKASSSGQFQFVSFAVIDPSLSRQVLWASQLFAVRGLGISADCGCPGCCAVRV
jgi:hypothetical protein